MTEPAERHEEMRRQMMANANAEAAEAKAKVDELNKQVKMLNREIIQLRRDSDFYRKIIERFTND